MRYSSATQEQALKTYATIIGKSVQDILRELADYFVEAGRLPILPSEKATKISTDVIGKCIRERKVKFCDECRFDQEQCALMLSTVANKAKK
jgi:hypothetical protein